MQKNLKKLDLGITHKINRIIWMLTINGVLLVLLAMLVVWSSFILKLLVGLTILVIAYLFFYLAYRVHEIKKHLEKFLK